MKSKSVTNLAEATADPVLDQQEGHQLANEFFPLNLNVDGAAVAVGAGAIPAGIVPNMDVPNGISRDSPRVNELYPDQVPPPDD